MYFQIFEIKPTNEPMKFIYLLAAVAALSFSSCKTENKAKTEIALGDTIQTASGLQYYYLKKGEGRKVETGSKMGTYLSLKVEDNVVWNTNELPDSLFTFVADYSRLIKGFTEMSLLLREGDEVVCILPDSLAYGAKGAGDIIPPHATLVYDQFKVIQVDAPKAFLSDLLFTDLKDKSLEDAVNTFNRIVKGSDSLKYHTDNEQMNRVWEQLTADSLHQKAYVYADQFGELTNDNRLKYRSVLSMESMGEFLKAKDKLELLLVSDPDNERMQEKMIDLCKKHSESK